MVGREMVTAILIFACALPLAAQPAQPQSDGAGSCARCHIGTTVEWNISKHRSAGVTCVRCHGASEGHVVEERNHVKPERTPQGAAIGPFCRECHTDQRQAPCQTCHHVHALVDPRKKAEEFGANRSDRLFQARQSYEQAMKAGEAAILAARWKDALGQFEKALALRPGDPVAVGRAAFCRRRLHPDIPGFRPAGDRVEPATGLFAEVEVAGFGIRMLAVAGGGFDMGDDRFADSRPVHTVRLSPYYLGRTEVTQGEWERLMGSNPSVHKGPELPVENVSWNDCQEFVRRLNGRVPGGGFRLPTEAEWEFAARAGLAAGAPGLPAAAWYRENSQIRVRDRSDFIDMAPRAAGHKAPNALGFYDMQGNVWEWCSSLFRRFPFEAGDGREDRQREGGRVLRGGSYADAAELLDPALRHFDRPDRRLRWNGLRLARDVPAF